MPPGQALLWGAVILFGLSNPVIQKLMTLGAAYPVAGQNPISLCNILFVGNICALPVLWILHRQEITLRTVQALTKQEWTVLLVVAILGGAVAPALLLQGLGLTSVNNVILVGRLEPLLLLSASAWIFKEMISPRQWWGAGLAFGGGLVALGAPTGPMMGGGLPIGQGEVLVALGTLALILATVLGRTFLRAVSTGFFIVVRTLIGTIIFFGTAWVLYGPEHFAAAFSPLLWQWMILYGVIIVALGQLLWFSGLRRSTLAEAALANSFLPIIGLVGTYGILGILPTPTQWISVALVLLGLLLAQGSATPWREQIS